MKADVLVIGAGPAGCSAAIHLAREGLEVALADKARFPRAKPCGEGVMPAGIPLLEELGVLPDVEASGRRFYGLEFTSRAGRRAAGFFPRGRYGITLRRERLDHLLFEQAASRPNIAILESHRAEKPLMNGRLMGFELAGESLRRVSASMTLIADGSLSTAARALGLSRRLPARARYGLRAHFSGVAGLKDVVEIFFRPDGEIYVAPQPGESALVSVLVEEKTFEKFAGRTQAAFLETLSSCPDLRERMRRAELLDKIIGLGPLGGAARRWEGPGWLLVGDAASALDPIGGEGISVALANGRLAARETLLRLRGTRSPYSWKRRRLLWSKGFLSRFLLAASRHPSLAELSIRALEGRQRLFSLILSDC